MTYSDTVGPPTPYDNFASPKTPPPWVRKDHRGGSPADLHSTLSADLTHALQALWALYAGVSPKNAHTQIDGNTVTCVLVDGVSDFNRCTELALSSSARDPGTTHADYKREAVAEVTRLTRQRVISFLSSHDRDTDAATEIFTLEPSLSQGPLPLAQGRFRTESGVSADRLEQASLRDKKAKIRDLDAQARDAAAVVLDRAEVRAQERRDALIPLRDKGLYQAAERYETMLGEGADYARERAAEDRMRSAKDRELASQDRYQGGRDRDDARLALQTASLDDLTGAYGRAMGLVALQHEIDRAGRVNGQVAFAFVDVHGVKSANDRGGHAAVDSLLVTVVHAIRSKMRSYEPIVRLGGDAFVCALADVDTDTATRRFDEIKAELASRLDGGAISVGFAAWGDGEDVQAVVERAEGALARSRV